MLSVSVTHSLGGFTLDAAFDSEGGLTALFGRSGAGKTSLVNAIAGLYRPERPNSAVSPPSLSNAASSVKPPRLWVTETLSIALAYRPLAGLVPRLSGGGLKWDLSISVKPASAPLGPRPWPRSRPRSWRRGFRC